MSTGFQYAEIYPENAIEANAGRVDYINPENTGSIPAVFRERVSRSPEDPAYFQFVDGNWKTWRWTDVGEQLARWRRAFVNEGITPGDRVAIRLRNCVEWVFFDQGAMGCGLVVVPVYAEDRGDNIGYIIAQTQSRLLFVETYEQWKEIQDASEDLSSLQRVVLLSECEQDQIEKDERLTGLSEWLAAGVDAGDPDLTPARADLATIVFTSGTTGKPKGVMLSHDNILMNAYTGLHSIAVYPQDKMLSFLPLSHMFERTVGYYLNVITGSSVAFNRSIPELLEDMAMVRPTIIITVPRIFERAYTAIKSQLDEGSAVKRWLFNKAVDLGWERFEYSQGRGKRGAGQIIRPLLDRLVGSKVRQRFGGNLRFVVSGGAPLAAKISRVFVGLGIDILQGYGLTEASPILTVNTLSRNKPDSIGLPLHQTQLRLAENNELQAKGPGIMQGYWKNEGATRETMTEDGWLMTGDVATISEEGFISITGRIKEIIVLATGEKVPPSDMEAAICDDPIFEQAMIVGEGRAFLSAILVINAESWNRHCRSLGFQPAEQADFEDENVKTWALKRVSELIEDFPGYANVYQLTLSSEPWTVEDGALTPTMKIKRPVLRERFNEDIGRMYEGH